MELGNMVFGNSRGEWPVPRNAGYERELIRLLLLLDPEDNIWRVYGTNFENDVFWVMPYFWGDCDCQETHAPDCPVARDNFHYKPSGFGLQWYKYPLRDSYANREVSVEEFRTMINECIASIQK